MESVAELKAREDELEREWRWPVEALTRWNVLAPSKVTLKPSGQCREDNASGSAQGRTANGGA
jgi:hypothetical protein